jgi:hypothetical protein
MFIFIKQKEKATLAILNHIKVLLKECLKHFKR